MSKPATIAKKSGIRMFILALALLLMPLMGEFTPHTKAVPALGVHDYYSNQYYTTQVGSVTWQCNYTSCCAWGYKTNYVIYTPFNCDEPLDPADPVQ
jgi:hypothetical protein